jgi:hypothetical protein
MLPACKWPVIGRLEASVVLPAGIAFFCGFLTAADPATAAGTAFAIDTAEVSEPGSCKVEAWTSWADNRDGLATINPACVVDALVPTEISVQIVRDRTGDEWSTSLTPKAKSKLVPTSIGSFGFAFAAGTTYDFAASGIANVFAYVPATLRMSENTRINLNAGWQVDREASRHFATYGIGFDWRFTETWIWTIETFGLLGSAPTRSETWPRLQTGFRFRPVDKFSMDFIYGRNINGENADWVTAGTTIRF